MNECMYVCMQCMYVFMYACLYVGMYVCMFASWFVCFLLVCCLLVCLCACLRVSLFVRPVRPSVRLFVRLSVVRNIATASLFCETWVPFLVRQQAVDQYKDEEQGTLATAKPPPPCPFSKGKMWGERLAGGFFLP